MSDITEQELRQNTAAFVAERNKQEYLEYLRSEQWQFQRGVCLEYYQNRCAICNGTRRIEVHHRTYERLYFELPSDLIALCDNCHEKFHDKLDKIENHNGWLG